MIKRGRPKGATAYPETAVCIKCGVFRPKRRGFCDRCRPRNRGAAAKIAAGMASAIAPRTSLSSSPPSAAQAGVKTDSQADPMTIVESRVAGQLEATNKQRSPSSSSRRTAVDKEVTSNESRGVKRQHHSLTGETSEPAQAQIRGKRRRTVSAPATATIKSNNHHSTLPLQASLNRNVDVVSSSYAGHGTIGQGKDRKLGGEDMTGAGWPFSSFTASHQLALLLPRSDGTAVDVVPLQYLQSASPTATMSSSPSPALASHGSSVGSSPTSSPSIMSSAHSLMSLANVSVLAASRYPSPSSYSSSSSSPASSPPRSFVSWSSTFSSPEASSLSSPSTFVLPATPSSKLHAVGVRSQSKAGDLMLPSLGSLALPRPALPRSFYQAQTAAAGLHLESMVAPSTGRLSPN